MRQRHRRNRVSMVRHPAAHQGYRRSRHAPSRNGLTRQHPERRLSSTLLLEKQSAVDNNRRYVSPRVRRKPFARASAGIFPGQIFQKEVSLPTLLTYRRFFVQDEPISRKKEGRPIGISRNFEEAILFHGGRNPEAGFLSARWHPRERTAYCEIRDARRDDRELPTAQSRSVR